MSVLSRLGSFRGSEDGRGRPARRSQPAVRYFRPTLEGLEDRRVMNFGILPQNVLASTLMAALQTPPSVSLNFTGVTAQNGQLVAQGFLQGQPFTAPLTLTATPASTTPGSVPVLDLQINAIHLNLLGLTLDTSNICLDITAQPGTLLGGLLSGLLSGNTLGNLLGGLTSGQLTSLTNDLTSLLNGVAGQLTSTAAIGPTSAATAATTNLLHLSLGPVNLNLLGLNIHLDNCANGPITIDLGAQSGPGDLLGNLFTDVANLLNGPLGTPLTDQLLTTLADDVLLLL